MTGYNTTRPHQALDLESPAARFRPGTLPETPLRLSLLDSPVTAPVTVRAVDQAPTITHLAPARAASPASKASPAEQATNGTRIPATGMVDRKVTSNGTICFGGATYSAGRAVADQIVQVTCPDGIVQILHRGELVRAWPRRHPAVADARPHPGKPRDEVNRTEALRLAPLDDVADDTRVVHRRVDPTTRVSFAGCYYAASRALVGQVVQVRCDNGVVQLIHDGELVRAWRQRHTAAQEQRMFLRPTPQQRTANAQPLTPDPSVVATPRHGSRTTG